MSRLNVREKNIFSFRSVSFPWPLGDLEAGVTPPDPQIVHHIHGQGMHVLYC